MSSIILKSCFLKKVNSKSLLYNKKKNIFYKIEVLVGGYIPSKKIRAIPSDGSNKLELDSCFLADCLFWKCEGTLERLTDLSIVIISPCLSVKEEEDGYYLVIDKNIARQKSEEIRQQIVNIKSNFILTQKKEFEDSIREIEEEENFFFGDFSKVAKINALYEETQEQILDLASVSVQFEIIANF